MGEKSNQIERHIQQTRNDLSDHFGELEAKVKMAVDWRAQCEQRPGTMMALAFGGGVLLSALLPSGRSSRRRSSAGRWTAPRDRDAPGRPVQSGAGFDGNASLTVKTWDALKGALIAVATAELSGFIEDLLPGFEQEFTKAQTGSAQPSRQESAAPPPKSISREGVLTGAEKDRGAAAAEQAASAGTIS